jgi:hypothetical protein
LAPPTGNVEFLLNLNTADICSCDLSCALELDMEMHSQLDIVTNTEPAG